jgi:hypothetical protein
MEHAEDLNKKKSKKLEGRVWSDNSIEIIRGFTRTYSKC